jgi:hypothetical protein
MQHAKSIQPKSRACACGFATRSNTIFGGGGWFLRETHDVDRLRITMHRAVNREDQLYLQQTCGYIRSEGLEWRGKVGRTFKVSEGIMGAAFKTRRIWRTKMFPTIGQLRACLAGDIEKTKDDVDPATVEISFLAVPFLGPRDEPVLILYADCNELNFFADDRRVATVVAMSLGFCRLFDFLQSEPFLNLRNFPLQRGQPVEGEPTVYASVQESLSAIDPPRFKAVPSFNYEAAAA